MRVNGSNLCAVRTVEINLSTRMKIAWHQGKANINRLLGNPPPETRIARESTRPFPIEIMEMFVAHIARDFDALRALSLTCHSWYIVVAPHLHRTIILTNPGELKDLSELHQLELMPLVQEIWVEQYYNTWLVPQAFSRRDLYCFSAFSNVQTLVFERLEISRFVRGVERYFGHFSPTLRSIVLVRPFCTPRQLSHFLCLFPNLDDIAIWEFSAHPPNLKTISDAKLVSFSTPRLRGRLVLRGPDSVETWERLIASGGGLQFHYMDLWRVGGCAPVLFEACTETLEALRFYVADTSVGEYFSAGLSMDPN